MEKKKKWFETKRKSINKLQFAVVILGSELQSTQFSHAINTSLDEQQTPKLIMDICLQCNFNRKHMTTGYYCQLPISMGHRT